MIMTDLQQDVISPDTNESIQSYVHVVQSLCCRLPIECGSQNRQTPNSIIGYEHQSYAGKVYPRNTFPDIRALAKDFIPAYDSPTQDLKLQHLSQQILSWSSLVLIHFNTLPASFFHQAWLVRCNITMCLSAEGSRDTSGHRTNGTLVRLCDLSLTVDNHPCDLSRLVMFSNTFSNALPMFMLLRHETHLPTISIKY